MLTQETQGQFVTLICICRINIYKGWVMPPSLIAPNKKATYNCIRVAPPENPQRPERMCKRLHLVVCDYNDANHITTFYRLVKSRQAAAAQAGTCPFPMALSLSTLWATP